MSDVIVEASKKKNKKIPLVKFLFIVSITGLAVWKFVEIIFWLTNHVQIIIKWGWGGDYYNPNFWKEYKYVKEK